MGPLSFNKALEMGKEPRDYNWKVPAGDYEGVLDFRVWGKSVNVQCFFTFVSGEKYILSAFRTRDEEKYSPKDQSLDFSSKENLEGERFRLSITVNNKGRTAWNKASMV